MSKVINADQAAALIKDGAIVAASGFGFSGWAEEVCLGIERRFLESGHPRGITFIHASSIGNWKPDHGTTRIAKEGLIKRWIGAFIGTSPEMSKLVINNKIEGYNLPQGVIAQLYREIAGKRPGLLTKVGLGTFVDPRLEGGKMNACTTEDIVRLVEFDDEEWLYYKSIKLDVALIRGSVVDENGNLTMDRESVLLEALPVAQAVKASGGIVIAQAEHLVKTGTLHPKSVKVPGILIDHVVLATAEQNHYQTEAVYFSPCFAGDIKIPMGQIPSPPLDERLIIARRAAMELTRNAIVNLGVGVPSVVASVASEEGISHQLTLTTEAGCVGGVPANPPNFIHAYNTEAVITHDAMFTNYDGGCLDLAFLGLAQADKSANVNVSKFNGRITGCGGFINITQNAKKVIFCGAFTADGLEIAVEDGKIRIVKEGKSKKFLEQVEQVTFSGDYAVKIQQKVLFVTERAVFGLVDGTLTLMEIAPGIDLQKDIIAQMGFVPAISPDIKTMPSGIFRPTWGELGALFTRLWGE